MNHPRVVVLGTDTGIGKTVVSAALSLAWSAFYFKPVQTGLDPAHGEPGDSATVTALGVDPCRILPPAYAFPLPAAPSVAAKAAGVVIDPAKLTPPRLPGALVVEPAGGLMVPVTDELLTVDLVASWDLPVLLVASPRLGTINHTLLSLEALRLRGLNCLGVVFSGSPDTSTRQAVVRFGRTRILAELPWLDPVNAESLSQAAPALTLLAPLAQAAGQRPTDLPGRDRRRVWHPFTQAATAPEALPVWRAKNATLTLHDGRRVFDAVSSWWVTPHGHGHPAIAEAVGRQARTLDHVIFADFTHEPATALAEGVCEALGNGFSRVFYSDNGSTAVEVALKMAIQRSVNQGRPRRRLAAFSGAYHGDTFAAMSVGKSCGYYEPFKDMLLPVDFLPYPCVWEGRSDAEKAQAQAVAALKAHLEAHGAQTAALIIEPLVQGAAGMRMCAPSFLDEVVRLCREYGVVSVFDEVMTGFGRTGRMFAHHHAQSAPDLVCLAKGLSGGVAPLAATVCREEFYEGFMSDSFATALAHGHSFTANPVVCAAGLASLALFEEESTLERVGKIEALHRARLGALADHPGVARPRVLGCIAAFEAVALDAAYADAASRTLKRFFLQRGQLLRPLGNTIYLMPPYCASPEELGLAWDYVEEALSLLATGSLAALESAAGA